MSPCPIPNMLDNAPTAPDLNAPPSTPSQFEVVVCLNELGGIYNAIEDNGGIGFSFIPVTEEIAFFDS